MDNLVEIKPTINVQNKCFFCQSGEVEIKDIVFQGIHMLSDCWCKKCSRQFYHTLPTGHNLLFPISFDKNGDYSCSNTQACEWLAEPLIDSFFKHAKEEGKIEKKVFLEKEDAIILNCLDNCYGHVFTKLWNAKVLLNAYPDMAVIVLLPKNMEWLVPEKVAEIWTVDISLGKLKKFISNLDPFIKQELKRFKTVYLSPAYVHLHMGKVDIEAFVKTKRFDLATFQFSAPQITFVLRDDRFWHGSAAEFFLFKVCVKFKVLEWFRRFFLWRQNMLINKVSAIIKQQLKEVRVIATGIGKTGGLSSFIIDKRSGVITDAMEKEWSTTYSKSHIVVGVHGSNMLIPTSLAAGFIELLPRHKIPHITEDLVLEHSSRYSFFLGRLLDHYAPADLVALHAVSMIRDFPFLYKNTEQKV